MELDDLKKSWNALDEQLQKDKLIDEDKLAELISKYKSGTSNSIRSITGWQRFSIVVGIIAIVIVAMLWCILPSVVSDNDTKKQSTILCLFFGLTLITGIGWDFKTYLWSKKTKVDEMPILIVAERMNKFSRWMKYEVIAISVWAVAFTALYYWVMGLYNHSYLFQLMIISLLVAMDVIIIYFVYKKLIYTHLDAIKRNIDELKGLNNTEASNNSEEA